MSPAPARRARILNFGSLNIDHVYQVEHIARPGETLSSGSYRVFAGGKGANQSAALARAGAAVHHAGQVGADGQWLLDKLAELGADVSRVAIGAEPTGHAVIQVDARGENAIFLYAGSNHRVDESRIDACLEGFGPGDILLLQNEINRIPDIIRKAHSQGVQVCLNPAPHTDAVGDYPLDLVHTLFLNQTEAAGLADLGEPDPAGAPRPAEELLCTLAARWPQARIVLTEGAAGARYRAGDTDLVAAAPTVRAVDTTGAGDTFIGYYAAHVAAGHEVGSALQRATAAAALACTRPGAMDSIPSCDQVDAFLAGLATNTTAESST